MQALRQESWQTTVSNPLFVLVWSSGYVVGAIATKHAEPLAITFWRFAAALVVFAVLARVRHHRLPRDRGQLALICLTGILIFAVQFGGLYIGLAAGMPAGTTALIACSSPLLVAAVGAALRWERLGWAQWVGIALGVLAVVVTLAERVGSPPSAEALAWTLLGLGGLGGGTLLQSRLRASEGYAVPALEYVAGTIAVGIWAAVHGGLGLTASWPVAWTMVWLSTVTGVGGPLLLFFLIRTYGATRASSRLFAVPAVTAIVSWPLLGTQIGVATVAGLALAGVGMALLQRGRQSVRSTRDSGAADGAAAAGASEGSESPAGVSALCPDSSAA